MGGSIILKVRGHAERSRIDDFGDHAFVEAFWNHFLRDFSEFGRPWGSKWETIGTTLAVLWAFFFETDF